MAFRAGHPLLLQLAKVLGLEGRSVRRVVLDVSVDSVAKLYVEEFVNDEHVSIDGVLDVAPQLRPVEMPGEPESFIVVSPMESR